MAHSDFPFIVSSGPKLQKDPSVRTLIRKQAMKDVANNRRKRGNHARVNTRQLPTFERADIPIRASVASDSSQDSTTGFETPESSESANETEFSGYDELIPRPQLSPGRRSVDAAIDAIDRLNIPSGPLLSDYESARATFQVDITDLAVLTNFNVGRYVMPILAADPSRLPTLLGRREWTYLQYVPSYYGSSEPLTTATNCLLGKFKSMISPEISSKETNLRLYANALRSLQDAISNETRCTDADVLCAMQLLSLHELLDPSRSTAWSHHIKGSARLVKYRTPARFTTEFDKALFAAHIGPVVSEALVDNVPCYLDAPEWVDLYRSTIAETEFLTDRSSLAVDVRVLMFPLPGLWHDVTEAVMEDQLFDDTVLAGLATRCRELHQRFIDWTEEYKAHCVRLSFCSPPQHEIEVRRELFGAALECIAILKRLLATVCDSEREQLETEAQALAQLILDLQKQPASRHSWLLSGHEIGIAYTLVLTKEEWGGSFVYDSDYDRRIASRMRYQLWGHALRMGKVNPVTPENNVISNGNRNTKARARGYTSSSHFCWDRHCELQV